MNLKYLKAKADSRSGVTLVELLVVILIVTILSVSLLPLLKPFITDAQYAAEPIPVVGNLRTMVGVYYYEHNYLPGLDHNTDGTVALQTWNHTTGAPTHVNSALEDGSTPLQTFFGDTTSGLTTYKSGVVKAISAACVMTISPTSTNDVDHFSNHINVDYQDLTGKRVKPKHFEYRVIAGGYKSGAYAYVLGVFGDADGLPAGTGYATIEIVNPDLKVKYVGTWKRNKPVSGSSAQIVLGSADDSPASSYSGAKDKDLCWIPQASQLTSSDATTFQTAITNMKAAGWEF